MGTLFVALNFLFGSICQHVFMARLGLGFSSRVFILLLVRHEIKKPMPVHWKQRRCTHFKGKQGPSSTSHRYIEKNHESIARHGQPTKTANQGQPPNPPNLPPRTSLDHQDINNNLVSLKLQGPSNLHIVTSSAPSSINIGEGRRPREH